MGLMKDIKMVNLESTPRRRKHSRRENSRRKCYKKEIDEENTSKKKSYEEKKKLQKWVRDNPMKMTRDLREMKHAKKCHKSLEIMLTKGQKENFKMEFQEEKTFAKKRATTQEEMVLLQRNHAKIRR